MRKVIRLFVSEKKKESPTSSPKELPQIPPKSGYADLIALLEKDTNPYPSISEATINELTILYPILNSMVNNLGINVDPETRDQIINDLNNGNKEVISELALKLVKERLGGRVDVTIRDRVKAETNPIMQEAVYAFQLVGHIKRIVFEEKNRSTKVAQAGIDGHELRGNNPPQIAGVPIEVRRGVVDVPLDLPAIPK